MDIKERTKRIATLPTATITIIVACIAAGIIAVFFGLFLLHTLQAEPVSRLLSANRTIGFLRMQNTPKLREKMQSLLSKAPLTGSGATGSGAIASGQFTHKSILWLHEAADVLAHPPASSRTLTLAILQEKNDTPFPILLFEFENTQWAAAFRSDIAGENASGQPPIISPVTFAPLGKTVFALQTKKIVALSPSEETLQNVVETIRHPSTALARSAQYRGTYRWKGDVDAFLDPKKAIAMVQTMGSDNRTVRDVATVLDPLLKNTQGVHFKASARRDGTYQWHARVTGSPTFFRLLQSTSRRAPPIPNDPNAIIAVSGTNILGGFSRLSDALGQAQPDSRIVLHALARYLLATYISPRLTREGLMATNTGGYWMVATQDDQGGRTAYGSLELDPGLASEEKSENWLHAFGSESRLMQQRKTRHMAVDDKTVPEAYFSVLPFRAETVSVGTVLMQSLRIEGKNFSPSIAWRNGQLFYATHASVLKTLLERKEKDRNDSPSGEFSIFINLAKMLPPLQNVADIRLAAGINLRNDGAEARGTLRLDP